MNVDELELAENLYPTVDEWLDMVDYDSLNEGSYVPSEFALSFVNFIKLVNGSEGESDKTPVVHLKMLDKIAGKKQRIANLCARGMAKTTLMFEYLVLYLAVFGEIPGFGKLDSMLYVSDSMDNGVKSARKNIEFRYYQSEWLQEWIPEINFTDARLDFKNKDGKVFAARMFGAKTGIRGVKIFGKRPKLVVLDDLISDDDAKSPASMDRIRDTVYKGIDHALDPKKRKIIFNGTPFGKNDILYAAVESGAWDVSVWPVCEHFPCEKKDFKGAWEDRFTYEFIKKQYDDAVLTGTLAAFNQELMLRISSSEERLVQDDDIRWYSRKSLLHNRGRFNFYITTDFATSDKQTADFSVISVWAYNSNGDLFWVDGVCKKQTMDKSINDLFRLVQEYSPQSVGIEVTGQQGAFINWIQEQQMERNIWFSFAQQNGKAGIRPTQNKLTRFNQIVPWFKSGKMYFPSEMKETLILNEFMSELSLATINGLKGKDDCLDTMSMLYSMILWKPSEETIMTSQKDGIFDIDDLEDDEFNLSSYIV
ncbi:MAG: hypothetical protein COA63_014055 [Methylophaga sp.]|nr:hypothetical protein [Methylophaga sp.]